MTHDKDKFKWFAPEFDVDTADRDTLVKYLKNHFRYYTMNSWNQSTSYANNVKLYNLELEERFGKEVSERCWDIVLQDDLDVWELTWTEEDIIAQFREDTGYDMGYNGRSSGYLVLYATETTHADDGKLVRNTFPGRDIDKYADFEDKDEWSLDELRERARIVKKFDEACDQMVTALVNAAMNGRVELTEETVVVTRKKLVINKKDED